MAAAGWLGLAAAGLAIAGLLAERLVVLGQVLWSELTRRPKDGQG